MEAIELLAQLDAVIMDNLNEDGEGNHLFFEVNDGREQVENQMKLYRKKFDMLKNNYIRKMTELFSITGSSHSDSGHTSRRLGEFLTSKRTKNKSLWDSLDTLEKFRQHLFIVMPLMSNETVLRWCHTPRVTSAATCPASWPTTRGATRS